MTLATAMVVLLVACGVDAAGPRRVLLIHSFSRDFAPFDQVAAVFRTELAQQSPEPVILYEANLDLGRTASEREQEAFVEYLRARFDDAPPEAVVTIGAPAAAFYLRNRARLFPDAPLVAGSLDERLVPRSQMRPGDSAIANRIDLSMLVDNILTLLPDTRSITVVLGASELERFWQAQLKRELASYMDRIRFEWTNDLSLAQIEARIASLPPHSVVLYGLMVVDAAGIPHQRLDALATLYRVANAPMFGPFEAELGHGVVGGPYASQRESGERLAKAASRTLLGRTSSLLTVDVERFKPATYDARELTRWKIDRGRLPAGSEIRFTPPSLWEEHRVAVIAITTALILQAFLITALLLQSTRRRRAEREAEGLAGRLVTAHEDERRRLARELHDDVTQRLAGLAIEAANLEAHARANEGSPAAHAIREGLVELGQDVHALSYRLHPSVIEDLGLVEALRIECDRLAQHGQVRVNLECKDVPRKLPADLALCLFRVAQEALRNVERHARANDAQVSVDGKDGGIALAVRDNGEGFDSSQKGERASLGLASMRERVRLLGGRLDIESSKGNGTRLLAWVPLAGAA